MKCPYLQAEFDAGLGASLKGPFPNVRFVVSNECEPGMWPMCLTCKHRRQREQMPEEYDEYGDLVTPGRLCFDESTIRSYGMVMISPSPCMNCGWCQDEDLYHHGVIRVQGYGEE